MSTTVSGPMIFNRELIEEKKAWHERLAQVAGFSNVIPDFERPSVYSGRRETVRVVLAESVNYTLNKLAGQSPFLICTALMGALKVCLYRYSGSARIVVGTPATKEAPRANALAIIHEIDDRVSFRQLLSNIRETLRDAYSQQSYPFHQLVKDLELETTSNRCPVFDVTLTLEDLHGPLPELKNDISISFRKVNDQLEGVIEFSPELFERKTIERFSSHYLNVLEQGLARTETLVSEFELVTADERFQLLSDWNHETTVESPECFHRRFERQAATRPNGIALSFRQQVMTYGELNEKANQLARYLHSFGVGPEVLVGIMLERSFDMIVSILAVLKAGGAYLPLDPTYPAARLNYMLEDAQAPVLITSEDLVSELPAFWTQIIALDTEREAIADLSGENLDQEISAEQLAYVIYTSGSTGEPKGVMVPHRGLSNLAEAFAEIFEVDPESRVLQFSSLSFDASVEEIVTALMAGATLCLESQDALLPGAQFVELLNDRGITTVTLPPSLLAMLPDDDLPNLHAIMVAGEACSAEVVRRWSTGHKLINAYGPTEATVCATMDPVPVAQFRKPPIGRPISNAQVYLLDGKLRLAPIGVPGELYIGGIGLCRGYLRRPDLTAERLLPNPFSNTPGSRLYRSGDLARYLSNGQIEYLGRVDRQVKIRGYRIELGEIEALLDAHPGVRESVVVAREDEPGDKRLVAYFISNTDDAPTTSELHNFLQLKLPLYMVPAAFVAVEAWPLSPNLKIDYDALPHPDQERPLLAKTFVAPMTPVEQLLANIWAETLRLERVGIHDNFFELGGDSILSIQIIARANQAGLQLQARQIFKHQTIAELVANVGTVSEVRAEQGLVVGAVPLTPIQHWFFEHHADNPHHYNQSVQLESEVELDADLLEQAVRALLFHHDALRLRFARDGEGWRQWISAPEADVPFSRVDFSKLETRPQQIAVTEMAGSLQRSLDLEHGPLLRVAYFDLGQGRSRLLLVIHHLVVDGVSWRVLLEDLQRAYEQLRGGSTVELGLKTTSWQHWAERLLDHAQRAELRDELGYWTHSRSETSQLPLDFPQGENLTASARVLSVELDQEETEALLREVPKAYHTQINDVLLAVLVIAYSRWTGARSLSIDLEGHGREEFIDDVNLSRTVGWFTTIAPVLLELPEDAAPEDALIAVKEQLRRLPRNGLGYGLLRYLTNDATINNQLRACGSPALSFNYLGQFDQVLNNDSSIFRPAKESAGASSSSSGTREHVLEINGSVIAGQLQLGWTYSENLHQRATIEEFAHNYLETLRALISHCQSAQAGAYTPSDFPLAKLSAQELKLLSGNHRDIEDIYPLAPLQHGLLFHTLYAPDSGVYLAQLSYQINKQLDVDSLARAWQAVVDRHPILRTAFRWEGLNEPVQVVRRQVELPWEYLDWTSCSAEERNQRLAEYLNADRERGLDLSVAPVMRCALIQLTSETYQFVWQFHHLLLDGWSMSLLFKEVFALYGAFAAGGELQLEKPRPYRDYVAWLQRQDLSESETFWRDTLSGFTAPTPLVIARPTSLPSDNDNDREDQRLTIPAAQTELLQSLLRRYKLTMNTLVQGVWALLLSRYSGEDDVVFGATVSGRPTSLHGVDSIMGLFINMLPVRARVSPSATLSDWLQELQAQQVEARQYEYTPLAQIQGWSDVPRGQSLFESVLVFENYPVDDSVREAGQSMEIRDVHAVDKMNYPLALVVMSGRELSFRVAYDSTRFAGSAVVRLLDHLHHLLEEIIARPEQKLSHLSLLTARERELMLTEWNNTQLAAAPGESEAACAEAIFELHAARSPRALALAFGELRFSYSELNTAANRLAHYLREHGVDREVCVAICLERSPEMIIALLAVLKAGGTYLPLDPSYPIERLSFMLEDSQAAVLVTRGQLAEELPAYWGQVIDLDEQKDEIETRSGSNLGRETYDQQGAYIIYTSGSTGRPKGVVVSHGGLFNLTQAQRASFDPRPDDRVLQFASFSFDASIFEIVMALCKGASLWLASREELMPGAGFAELLANRSITNATLPPSVLPLLPPTELPNLRTLIVAGEACPATVVDQWAPGRQFFNAYGPTETTVWATVAECIAGMGRPHIGRPIANAEIFILDRNFQPVPVGVTGELYIGGKGVAREYLKRPELTAERFVPHPFSSTPGARLYRTGDLACFGADGQVEFLGRADEQVKLRGFRIELGEVEATLREHPTIKECVVVTASEPESQRLVAYVAPNEGEKPTTNELRNFLEQRLPEYMVPAVFVTLDHLPLTRNGKIDRSALPAPDEGRLETSTVFVAPRSPIEQSLAEIWSEVLNVGTVGIDDSFFTLGGDSIRSVQILSKAHERGLNFTLQQLFHEQTIRNLAQGLTIAETPIPAIEPGEPFCLVSDADRALIPAGVEDAYPLSMVQAGMLFHSDLDPDSAIYHSINSFHLKAPLNPGALRKAIDYMAARHPLLRTSFDLGSFSEPLQLVHASVSVPINESDLRHLSHAEQETALKQWLELERVRHFDWRCAPLLRIDVHRRTEESFQFTFTAHHAIIDGWSDGVFLTELLSIYTAFASGEDVPAAAPQPASTFRQYIALEREALESKECKEFWMDQLNGIVSARLPHSPETNDRTPAFSRVAVPVTSETSAALKRLAETAGVPIKSVLLAAHLRVMSLLTGQTNPVTGVVWNGRPETTDGERMIGLFLNTLPFHASLRGGSWLELVRETFSTEKEIMPFRRYPLSQLQKILKREQIFDTCFNFTHMHVYESTRRFDDVELLSGMGVAETNFALMANFSLNVASGEVQLALDCKTSDLQAGLDKSLAHYYARTLAAMAHDWNGRSESCDLLPDEERRQLLEEYNDTALDYPLDVTMVDMFERQVALAPNTIALVAGGERMTYAELDQRAEKLALQLFGLGVGPETVVGVCAGRSADLVAALLGVLKAGGAYLPLDPAYPAERVSLMLADSEATVLVTERQLAAQLPRQSAKVIYLDEAVAVPAKRTKPDLRADNLAYVIYTSGSSGRPKGVAITHQSAAVLLHWAHDFFSRSELAAVLASTSVCFDLSVFEIFAPLTCGGTVVLANDALQLPELPAAQELTLINTVPSAMAELLRLGAVPASVRTINLAGEALRRNLVEDIYQQLPSVRRVLNLYGPTEDTTYSTWREVERGAPGEPEIGRGVANTRLYVLDSSLRLLPAGVSGELYIAGQGLARGYLNRASLTAERFIPDPYSTEPGARMYRTGDLARHSANGELEYLGRIDQQVKVRGYRIELGEIEAALIERPEVRECGVIVSETTQGEKLLLAFVVPNEAGGLQPAELRAALRQRLPEYMVPPNIIVRDSLPATPNGKLDRRALANFRFDEVLRNREYQMPETPTQTLLAEIWAEVLDVERISLNHNFFELGGHSLSATRLVSRIQAAFGVKLPLRKLLLSPTLATVATAIEEAMLESSSQSTIDELMRRLDALEEADDLALDDAHSIPRTKSAGN